MELRRLIDEINQLIFQYWDFYPKHDWDEKTLSKLLNNFTYHSNKIEGLTMKYGETIKFLNTGLIENSKLENQNTLSDITMLSNHQKALSMIFRQYHHAPISVPLLKDLHKEVMTTHHFIKDDEIKPGYYRSDDIGVLRTDNTFKWFVYDTQVGPMMEELVIFANDQLNQASMSSYEYHPFLIGVDLHVRFLNIHPFTDGNGRIARLLMNLINLKHKIPMFSPKSSQRDRLAYYQTFDKCDKTLNSAPMQLFLGKQLIELLRLGIEKAKTTVDPK